MRIGIGYDVHRFGQSKTLKLGGITIPHRGLAGHSDADVLLHALTDALFGAIGAADIGEQFPSSNPRFRGMESRAFVEAACKQMRKAGWQVGNIDATVITDSPRLVGFKKKMAKAISELVGVQPSQVSVKAKTTESFCPHDQGIAAYAVALLVPADKTKQQRKRA